jgi:hypothetical protein
MSESKFANQQDRTLSTKLDTPARKAQEAKVKRDEMNFDNDDERQAAFRFQEQCHLMLNWKRYTSLNRNTDPNAKSLAGKPLSEKASYRNFVTLDHDRPYELINGMFKISEHAEELFKLSSHQLSLLVPEVRLFKVYVEPFAEAEYLVELPFDDFSSKTKIENITKTAAGRGGGAGLNFFKWKGIGKHSGNQFLFGAELSMHFQGIEDLLETRGKVTIPTKTGTRDVEVSFSDLIIGNEKFKNSKTEGTRVYNDQYFRLRAVVGWHLPTHKTDGNFFSNEARSAISDMKVTLNLGLEHHELEFEEDGSVTLGVHYVASTEARMNHPQKANVLFPSPASKDEVEKLAQEIQVLNSKLKTGTNVLQYGVDGLPFSAEPESSFVQFDDTERAKKNEELKKKEEQLAKHDNSKKIASYKRFLSDIWLRNKFRTTYVDKATFDQRVKAANHTQKGRIASADDVKRAETLAENSKGQRQIDVEGQSDLAVGDALRTNDPKKFGEIQKDLAEFSEDITDSEKESLIINRYPIKYFFLGDLLETTLSGMFKKSNESVDNYHNKNLKIILGPLTFYDYGNLEDHGLVEKRAGVKNDKDGKDHIWKGKLTSINIADIPISLRVFSDWFSKVIVDPGLETMSFQDFLSKLMSDLVIKAVSTECYEFAPKQQARIIYRPFSASRNKDRDEMFRANSRVNFKDIKKHPFTTPPHRAGSNREPVEDYILIYGSHERPHDLKGDYKHDLDRGIYHLFFGEEKGLVQSIKFKREDIPSIRAANIAMQFNESKKANKILREKYNASVSMFGNNLFLNGMMVHISPYISGGGSLAARFKTLRALGLGGYFQVLTVTSKIEAGAFETELETVWTSPGDGTLNNGDSLEGAGVIRVAEVVQSPTSNAGKQASSDSAELVGKFSN